MNSKYNMMTINTIRSQHLFIKPLTKRKAMSSVMLPFFFHQPNPFVENLMRV